MAEKEVDPMSNPEAPGTAVIGYQTADIPHVLSQIARLGEGLKAEFDLIAGRMSWLVIAESFNLSAFATATASYRPDHPLASVLRYLGWILPFVGMFMAACVYVAILAALSAVHILKDQRDRMMAGLPRHLQIDLISANSSQQRWGNLPTNTIPFVLLLVWAIALVFALI